MNNLVYPCIQTQNDFFFLFADTAMLLQRLAVK